MVHMVLLLVILKVKSYVSQGQILLVDVATVLRDKSYRAYHSLT